MGTNLTTRADRVQTDLSRPDFDVEIVPFIGDLHDLRPGKAVDAQLILIDQQTTRTNADQDINTFRILESNQTNSRVKTYNIMSTYPLLYRCPACS